jgi:hypothetical protein
MKRSASLLFYTTLLLTTLLLPACNKKADIWWLEMNYVDTTGTITYNMNMPITILEDDTLSGLGTLVVRQLIVQNISGLPKCLSGETNGLRVQGEITLIGNYSDGKILVESLEPTGGPGIFSYVYYCLNNNVERDVKAFKLDPNTSSGQLISNEIINALYVFSEGMLKFPMDPEDELTGQDDQGFSFVLHQGNLPESEIVPTPYISEN